MNRSACILALGLALGFVTHLGYYHLRRPASTDTLDGQLAWIKTELQLTDVQFERIRELHQSSSPRLRTMATQVAELQTEFAAFEKLRRTNDRVDFLEFARFVETRRHVSRECLDSTRQLVLATAEVMTPRQRQQYLDLVATAGPPADSLLN